MPWAPPRPCPRPGCPRLLGPGQTCPEHPPRPGRVPFATSTYRTRPAIPPKLRQRILERDRRTCQQCGKPGSTVDHITPRAAGGSDDPANLRVLCQQCHRRHTGRQAAAMMRGR